MEKEGATLKEDLRGGDALSKEKSGVILYWEKEEGALWREKTEV